MLNREESTTSGQFSRYVLELDESFCHGRVYSNPHAGLVGISKTITLSVSLGVKEILPSSFLNYGQRARSKISATGEQGPIS